jgi:hypothetical protein
MKILFVFLASLFLIPSVYAENVQQIKVDAVKDYLRLNREMSKLWTDNAENPNDLTRPVIAAYKEFETKYEPHRSIAIANHKTFGDFLDQVKANVDYYVSAVGISKSNTQGYLARYEDISNRVFDTLLSTLFLVADNHDGKLTIRINADQRSDILDELKRLYVIDFKRYDLSPEKPSYMWALYEMRSQLNGKGSFLKE